ncbi:MAG: NUMOD3 domain-containing DNA-binding protein [Candidatus Paceibacterota bacterium]|jgi:predicted RNA-binding Zn-ribbon protein involved in translation (DUF1610 family)
MVAPKDPIKHALWLERQRNSHMNKHPEKDTLVKMSESHKGIEPWNKGEKMPNETGKKISAALKNKPKPLRTKEHCENISKSKMGENNPMFGKHTEHVSVDMKCPKCGSNNIKKNGTKKSIDGKYTPAAKCNQCGYGAVATKFKV